METTQNDEYITATYTVRRIRFDDGQFVRAEIHDTRGHIATYYDEELLAQFIGGLI